MADFLAFTWRSSFIQQYKNYGYGLIQNFLNADEVQSLRNDIRQVIDQFDIKEHSASLKEMYVENDCRDSYYVNSVDNIGYFFN